MTVLQSVILNIAKTSTNPADCEIYFYDYVNSYLKAREDFRLKFLKAVYLNKNVYKLEDINAIVEYCGFENEYYFSNYFKKNTGMSPTDFRNTTG